MDDVPHTYPAWLRIKLGVCAHPKVKAAVPVLFSYHCEHWAERTVPLDTRIAVELARAGVLGDGQ